jgi:hypothetical protein
VLTKKMQELIEDCLHEGLVVEIDGKGTLELDAHSQLVFRRNDRITVFLAYAEEDRATVKKLYKNLLEAGFLPWMDKERLLPGQNWPRAIERAIETSDFFIGCFSSQSTNKRGHFQSELGYALDVASRVPAEEPFFIPARLNPCEIPRHITKRIHYVDLYPDWDAGVRKLIRALRLLRPNSQ